MNNAIKSETEANMECFIHLVIGEVVCHESDVARQLEQGKSFAEHNKTVFDVAMAVAIKWQAEQDKLMLDAKRREHNSDEKMTVFERVQSVCRYRCARFGDTYKCANGKSFGETCDKQNCQIIK